jgi:hypothetical protein
MKSLLLIAAIVGTGLVSDPTDALTGLPLYPGVSGGPDAPLPEAKVCQSTMVGDFYSFYNMKGAKVDGVTQWYASHLAGFHKYHAGGKRTQDTFFNQSGTLEVTVTGKGDGTDDVYSISYGRFEPGLSPRQMATFNVKQVCR